ncbi:hypothetical protein [Paenibacillus chibensis]|uniref:hypothetical protein n=1 Tax=Paenibacillus chibensis TaxID=59846 RepID=UPI0013E3C1E8|nr:hypothetical protein [Paenibacillus chibensis]MEC0373100.1 hypothetical protein [Paenibacillus chibensis]
MDFRNPPGQYDTEVHKKRHEDNKEKGFGSFRGLVWNIVNLLIAIAIIVLIVVLVEIF